MPLTLSCKGWYGYLYTFAGKVVHIFCVKVVLRHFVFSPRKDLLRQDVVHTPASRYQVGRSLRRSTVAVAGM